MIRILIAEDDDNDVFLLRYALNKAGVTEGVQVASDGQQVIDHISGTGRYADREQYPMPQLLLLDIKLPLRPGLEVLEWIRARPELNSLVVIMFTASAQSQDVQRAYDLGANSFVVKPSDLQSRADVAAHLKGWWLRHNLFGKKEGDS
jgi:CheY-like chemotaxis protein